MRDEQIYGMVEGLNMAVAHDIGLFHRLLMLSDARQQAMENVLVGRRFGVIRAAILQFLSPHAFARLLVVEQKRLYDAALVEQMRKQAEDAQKVKIAAPPKNGKGLILAH